MASEPRFFCRLSDKRTSGSGSPGMVPAYGQQRGNSGGGTSHADKEAALDGCRKTHRQGMLRWSGRAIRYSPS